MFAEPTEPITPEEPGGTPICWDTLWIDPPVPPETGVVQPAPATGLPGDDDSLWDNVVRDFSLVNINTSVANGTEKGSGGPYSPTGLLLPTGPPLDVPPDVIPMAVTDTMVAVDTRRSLAEDGPADDGVVSQDAQAVTVAPDIPASNSAAVHDNLADVDDPMLKAKDWSVIRARQPSPQCFSTSLMISRSGVLVAGETIRCVSPVRTPIRRGLYKVPRSCALILTTGPRVLCVALDDALLASKKLEAKHVFAFPKQSVTKSPTKGAKVLAACKVDSGQRKLVLLTVSRIVVKSAYFSPRSAYDPHRPRRNMHTNFPATRHQ